MKLYLVTIESKHPQQTLKRRIFGENEEKTRQFFREIFFMVLTIKEISEKDYLDIPIIYGVE
jgi:hypothetical protein